MRADCMSHVTKSRQVGAAVWLYSCQAASNGKNGEMTSDLAGAVPGTSRRSATLVLQNGCQSQVQEFLPCLGSPFLTS